MRKTPFVQKEYYHVYNRGVDKRDIFQDEYDFQRFLQSMEEFNTIEPIGSIFENQFRKDKAGKLGHTMSKLVDIICYCLNPNHYHFLITPLTDNGTSEFMRRLSSGYTKYFNEKYKRSGVLFQGTFKAVHVKTNEQLLHASAYVNLNDRVHKLGPRRSKSSWEEYINPDTKSFCNKDIILGQFNNVKEYEKSALESLKGILDRRSFIDDSLLIEEI